MPGLRALIAQHRARLISFALIGAVIFALQFSLQVVLVRFLDVWPVAAYIATVILCVQVNFLLNRRFTWADREVKFRRALYKFNTQKAFTTIINFALYAGLVRLRVNYLAANILTTSLFVLVNYAVGDAWAFASTARRSKSVHG